MNAKAMGFFKRYWLLVAVPFLVVAGCASIFNFHYKETAEPTIVLHDALVREFELEVRKTVEISGNMHGPSNPFAPSHVEKIADYIYIDTERGVIPADRIIFTHWRGCSSSVWWQKDMQGSVILTTDSVIIDLKMPRYEGSSSVPKGHVPWEHNGTYKLVRAAGEVAIASTQTCGLN
ncbi:hypothetical protein [Massilia horti]|uniref:Lipoprotein n=1 Tax=Massilia horti TaxID=2562153 RepID=A0A4Y9T868_9BURK|nr:hypothetical protein [Massilia horti]TFW35778.1 hypothetical protein E4O92_01090 [Massilia horti]